MRLRRSQRLSDFWREDPLLLIYIKPVRRTFLPETGEEDPARASRPLSRPEDALSRPALLLGGDSSRKAPFELYYYYCLRERAKRGAPKGGTARPRRDRRSHPRRAGRLLLLLLLLLARGPSTGSTSIYPPLVLFDGRTDGAADHGRPEKRRRPRHSRGTPALYLLRSASRGSPQRGVASSVGIARYGRTPVFRGACPLGVPRKGRHHLRRDGLDGRPAPRGARSALPFEEAQERYRIEEEKVGLLLSEGSCRAGGWDRERRTTSKRRKAP